VEAIDVTPVVTELDEDGYVIALRGSAVLSSMACGWFKTKIAWWRSESKAGMDILLDVPKSSREPETGTVFDARLYWNERGPGRGEPLWTGKYRVRNTRQGPIVEEVEWFERAV
jgi:hypothetical protein